MFVLLCFGSEQQLVGVCGGCSAERSVQHMIGVQRDDRVQERERERGCTDESSWVAADDGSWGAAAGGGRRGFWGWGRGRLVTQAGRWPRAAPAPPGRGGEMEGSSPEQL